MITSIANSLKSMFGLRSSSLLSSWVDGLLSSVLDVSNAVNILDRFHKSTHQGYAYFIDHEFTLSGTTPQYLEITVGGREIHLQERLAETDVSDILVELFYEPTVTVGTPVNIPIGRFNFTKDSNNTVTARTVQSFTGGESAGKVPIYGETGVGSRSVGTGASTSKEVNFLAGSKIGLKVQRRSGTGAGRVFISFGYYEIHS